MISTRRIIPSFLIPCKKIPPTARKKLLNIYTGSYVTLNHPTKKLPVELLINSSSPTNVTTWEMSDVTGSIKS